MAARFTLICTGWFALGGNGFFHYSLIAQLKQWSEAFDSVEKGNKKKEREMIAVIMAVIMSLLCCERIIFAVDIKCLMSGLVAVLWNMPRATPRLWDNI